MIPISDDNPIRLTPYVNWALVALCVAVFGYEFSLGSGGEELMNRLGFVPAVLFHPAQTMALVPTFPAALTVLTSMFLHGGFLHLGGNNLLPLTYVDNCAEAIVVAALTPGASGQVYNVVDDDLVTSKQYLALYKSRVAPVRSVPPAQAGAVNASVQQLNLPWRGLHDAVQAATPATIALLALEPDARKSSVRITAEAKNSDDMIAYVEALQRVEWFTTVLLARHEINEQDANRPIRFQIDAQWRAAR